MKESPPMGLNRTGIQMSPFDSSRMESPPSSTMPVGENGEATIDTLRSAYIAQADPLGSVPLPGTVSGAITTGMAMLAGGSPEILLDKLGERLAFERTGTRLYDALITKYETIQDGLTSMTVEDLRQIREDEARHFTLVADAIETLGGDPTAQTPSADLVGVESMGLVQVLTDPRTTLAQSLHAILTAELADQSGWEMLIALAEGHQQNVMINDFSVALNEECAHLMQVQTWYQEAILGTSYANGAGDADMNAQSP